MKQYILLCAGLLILAVVFCGCTSQPATAPATVPATQAPAPAPTQVTAPFVGKNWQLGWFDDTKGVWSKVAEGSTITAKFTTDGKVTGSSGCNDYTTTYLLSDVSKITIVRAPVQAKVCQSPLGVMGQESFYLTDLAFSKSYAITNGQLLFFDSTGKKILQFDPVP